MTENTNKKLLTNKKAALGPQTMIYVFFFCIILIAGGIVWGISAFFTQDYDFRYEDANTLAARVANCLQTNKITFTTKEQLESEFFQKCELNKQVIEEYYAIYIKFNDNTEVKFGRVDRTLCTLQEKNKNFPACVSTLTENAFIEVAANQKSRRVKIA